MKEAALHQKQKEIAERMEQATSRWKESPRAKVDTIMDVKGKRRNFIKPRVGASGPWASVRQCCGDTQGLPPHKFPLPGYRIVP